MSHSEHGHGHTEHSAPVTSATIAPQLYTTKEYKFSFKKQKVVDALTGEEIRRPPVIVSAPVPTVDGLLSAMADPKVVDFVLELVEGAIQDQIRTQITDDEKPVNRQEELDLDKLTLGFIANLPKGERTGGGISKETWEEFTQDYIKTMVPLRTVGGKTEEALAKVTKAATLLNTRLNRCRTDKPVLKFLREQLAIWADATENLEEFQEVYVYLDGRATTLMNADNVSALESL